MVIREFHITKPTVCVLIDINQRLICLAITSNQYPLPNIKFPIRILLPFLKQQWLFYIFLYYLIGIFIFIS
jgi:hypothetical protein